MQALKTKDCQFDNFVVADGAVGFWDDNLLCQQMTNIFFTKELHLISISQKSFCLSRGVLS